MKWNKFVSRSTSGVNKSVLLYYSKGNNFYFSHSKKQCPNLYLSKVLGIDLVIPHIKIQFEINSQPVDQLEDFIKTCDSSHKNTI